MTYLWNANTLMLCIWGAKQFLVRNKISKREQMDYEKPCMLHMGFKLCPVCDGKLLKDLAQGMAVPRFITKNDGMGE